MIMYIFSDKDFVKKKLKSDNIAGETFLTCWAEDIIIDMKDIAFDHRRAYKVTIS